jgi:hypothetical protein
VPHLGRGVPAASADGSPNRLNSVTLCEASRMRVAGWRSAWRIRSKPVAAPGTEAAALAEEASAQPGLGRRRQARW